MADGVRWGLISTAAINERSFIPAVRETDRGEIVAVASRSMDTARKFADKHGIRPFPEPDSLAWERVNAVYSFLREPD